MHNWVYPRAHFLMHNYPTPTTPIKYHSSIHNAKIPKLCRHQKHRGIWSTDDSNKRKGHEERIGRPPPGETEGEEWTLDEQWTHKGEHWMDEKRQPVLRSTVARSRRSRGGRVPLWSRSFLFSTLSSLCEAEGQQQLLWLRKREAMADEFGSADVDPSAFIGQVQKSALSLLLSAFLFRKFVVEESF